jgi:hypothetical protein
VHLLRQCGNAGQIILALSQPQVNDRMTGPVVAPIGPSPPPAVAI